MEPHSTSPAKPQAKRDTPLSQNQDDPGPGRGNHSPSSPPSLVEQEISVTADAAAEKQPASFLQALGNLFRGNGHAAHAEKKEEETTLKETLASLLEEHEEQGQDLVIAPEERRMLSNILRFGEMRVSDIMIPRPDIVAVEYGVDVEDLKQVIAAQQHSRMPVFRENLDQVEGFLHIKDLAVALFSGKAFSMDSLIRHILFVPPSMKVMDLLMKMRHSGVHIAIIVDEYGGTDGLVTMEDIVEEIVGEIQDEHDEEELIEDYVWIDERTIEADGRMEVEELRGCFGADAVRNEDEQEVDTVGGLVFSYLGHVPEEGEQFDYPTGLRITVLEAESRAVKRLRIERLEPAETSEPATIK